MSLKHARLGPFNRGQPFGSRTHYQHRARARGIGPRSGDLRRFETAGGDTVFGPRLFYALALLLIIGGVAAYTQDPDWHLPTGPKVARIASPSGGQAATPGSGGATAASGTTRPSNVAPAGGSAAEPGLTANANGAASANTRPALRRITMDSRDSTASVETSKPGPASAAGLLGGSADASSTAKLTNSSHGVPAAAPEASHAPTDAAKVDNATTPKAQAPKESAAADATDANGDASSSKAERTSKAHKTGLARLLTRQGSRSPHTSQKQAARRKTDITADAESAGKARTRRARHASSRYDRRMRSARRHAPAQDWNREERRATMVARSSDPNYSAYSAYPGYSGACGLEPRWTMTIFGYQQTWARVCH